LATPCPASLYKKTGISALSPVTSGEAGSPTGVTTFPSNQKPVLPARNSRCSIAESDLLFNLAYVPINELEFEGTITLPWPYQPVAGTGRSAFLWRRRVPATAAICIFPKASRGLVGTLFHFRPGPIAGFAGLICDVDHLRPYAGLERYYHCGGYPLGLCRFLSS